MILRFIILIFIVSSRRKRFFELGMEEALYDGVCLIEWPEKMGPYLPRHAIVIDIVPEKRRPPGHRYFSRTG